MLSLNPQHLSDIPKRLAAVRAFAALPEAAIWRRPTSASAISSRNPKALSLALSIPVYCKKPITGALSGVQAIQPKIEESFGAGDYTASLQLLATLKTPVDTFFDHVMVNVDDEKLRNNRLALLAQLHRVMNRIADLSKLAT